MITQQDVLQTMLAADPTVTREEAQKYYSQIDQALETRFDQMCHLLRQRWKQTKGVEPDGLTWGKMRQRAMIDAENQIRAEYLEELTQQATQRQLEEEEREMNSIPEDLWKTRPHKITPDEWVRSTVMELWGDDKEVNWLFLAVALLTTRERSGLEVPDYPDHPFIPEMNRMIDQALKERGEA